MSRCPQRSLFGLIISDETPRIHGFRPPGAEVTESNRPIRAHRTLGTGILQEVHKASKKSAQLEKMAKSRKITQRGNNDNRGSGDGAIPTTPRTASHPLSVPAIVPFHPPARPRQRIAVRMTAKCRCPGRRIAVTGTPALHDRTLAPVRFTKTGDRPIFML